MVYLEIITSIIIFIIMACMNAISTAYLSISEKDFDFNEIKNKNKVKNIKLFLKNSSSFIYSIEFGLAFLDLWLGAVIVEIIANPIYKNINTLLQGTAYFVKYIVIMITVLVLSYVLYVFAEIIPKTFAIKNKKKIVLHTANFVHMISIIFKPLKYFLNSTENVIMRIFNVERKKIISYKNSEIKGIVQVGKEKGVISNQESEILSNYLKIDEITAKDIMIDIKDVEAININSTGEEIKEIIKQGHTRIPVFDIDGKNIIGIINVKNLLQNMIDNKTFSLDKIIKPCIKVSSGKRLDLLFNEMKNNKEHLAIVENKNVVIGIVTMEDILEEIVGNIEDDYEKYKDKHLKSPV